MSAAHASVKATVAILGGTGDLGEYIVIAAIYTTIG